MAVYIVVTTWVQVAMVDSQVQVLHGDRLLILILILSPKYGVSPWLCGLVARQLFF